MATKAQRERNYRRLLAKDKDPVVTVEKDETYPFLAKSFVEQARKWVGYTEDRLIAANEKHKARYEKQVAEQEATDQRMAEAKARFEAFKAEHPDEENVSMLYHLTVVMQYAPSTIKKKMAALRKEQRQPSKYSQILEKFNEA